MKRSDLTPCVSNQADRQAAACGLWRRLLIMLYDSVAVIVLLMATTALAMLAGFRELSVAQDPLYAAALLLTWFLYLGWCWRRGGMTLGMRAWRVRIERVGGGLPGWGRCAGRFLASLLSAAPAGLGFWWSLCDRDRRCWHDRLSKTRLVRTAARPAQGQR
jgi:uncharacterized RDD family membrane protein YckC